LEEASRRFPGIVFQGLNQAYRFKHFPDEAGRALGLVLTRLVAMRDLCRARGIRFLVVILPTKPDVDRDDDATVEAAAEMLGLTPKELRRNRELGEALGSGLAAVGIEHLDPAVAMAASPIPLYWRTDSHLGFAGHVFLALGLEPIVRGWFDDGSRPADGAAGGIGHAGAAREES
jgi:hypothetical protein